MELKTCSAFSWMMTVIEAVAFFGKFRQLAKRISPQ